MGDYLDAGQIARLECLKLAMAMKGLSAEQTFALAHHMAAFVTDGTVPDTQNVKAA